MFICAFTTLSFPLFFFFLRRAFSLEKKHFLSGHSRGYLCSSWEMCSAEDTRVRKNALTHVLPQRRVRSLGTRRPPTVKCVNQVCLSRVTHSLEEFDGFLVSSSVVANSSQNQVKAGCKKLRQWRNQMCFVFSIFFAKWRWCGV